MIKLSQASFDTLEMDIISQVMNEKYLGMGRFVRMFEEKLAEYFGQGTHLACVNTGTSALHLAVQGCNIGFGDEVLIPTLTYVASFQSVSATGAKPIACDVHLDSGLIDLKDARKKITSKTKAIMPVHYAGNTDDIPEVYLFAKEYNLRVIEDAAHSFGGTLNGEKVGSRADIICFSFDSIKNITCGEGGAIVSSDENLIKKVRDLRLLGVENDTQKRFSNARSWDFDVESQGWRYHMSNLNAAIGLAQLTKLDSFIKIRKNLVHNYITLLKNTAHIRLFNFNLDSINPHIFPIRVEASHRNSLKEFLFENGIETGFHYKPNHLLTKFSQDSLPNAELLWSELLTLPLHCNLTPKDVSFICEKINEFMGQ